MNIFAVDQGGSKTEVLIADEKGVIKGYGKTGGACHQSSGMKKAMDMISMAFNIAADEAGLCFGDLEMVTGGITGADWKEDYLLLKDALIKMTGIDQVMVFNDAITALRSGMKHKSGVGICSGSATNIALIDKYGNQYAYGFFVQIKHISKMALEAVFDSYTDIMPDTLLTYKALEYFGVCDVEELMREYVLGNIGMTKVKQFAPFVFDACDKKDKISDSIVREFAVRCAKYICAAIRRSNTGSQPDVILSGGIFNTGCKVLYEVMKENIVTEFPDADISHSGFKPVLGALLMAYDEIYNKEIPVNILNDLKRAAHDRALIYPEGK